MFNILLFYHNRRSTETRLYNLRYLIMNSAGQFSNFKQLLEDFVQVNKDFV